MRPSRSSSTIIDIATLTGACMVALGKHKAGLMSNNDDLIEQLDKAADDSGEIVWHLPSGDEYAEDMKSKIADLRNTGPRWGGASTAAAFLRQFVGETTWATSGYRRDGYFAEGQRVRGGRLDRFRCAAARDLFDESHPVGATDASPSRPARSAAEGTRRAGTLALQVGRELIQLSNSNNF